MEDVLRFIGAYESASFVGLPTVDLHTNKERAKRAIHHLSERFIQDSTLRAYTYEFSEVLSILYKSNNSDKKKIGLIHKQDKPIYKSMTVHSLIRLSFQ